MAALHTIKMGVPGAWELEVTGSDSFVLAIAARAGLLGSAEAELSPPEPFA